MHGLRGREVCLFTQSHSSSLYPLISVRGGTEDVLFKTKIFEFVVDRFAKVFVSNIFKKSFKIQFFQDKLQQTLTDQIPLRKFSVP